MKEKIRDHILKKLKTELKGISQASQTTTDYSQSEDLKSEGKYDTRAIEAKYLADAQQGRVNMLRKEINLLKNFEFKKSSIIVVGSIIFLNNNTIYLILPISGQGRLFIDNQKIISISTQNELAKDLIGLEVDDSFEHPTTGKELLITKII
ncbi:MAG: hypothetical protein N4A33_07735 [Bacteriovoracaceae bacterium]|jgi:hypothetical protein|nr:hypothetical protein [Bacteriovoracaceae bacterium]